MVEQREANEQVEEDAWERRSEREVQLTRVAQVHEAVSGQAVLQVAVQLRQEPELDVDRLELLRQRAHVRDRAAPDARVYTTQSINSNIYLGTINSNQIFLGIE